MLRLIKNKTFIGIIKSGLAGALAFTGVSFIWVIVSVFKGPSAPVVVTTFMNSPKFIFAKEFLIVVFCIGFMLGILLRRCYPIMQKRLFLLVTILVMLGAIIEKEALVAIVCTCFILGVLLVRCFPAIERNFYLLVILLVMAVVPLGFAVKFLHTVSMNTEYPPLSLKLADCTNHIVTIHLKIPSGHDYRLDLETTNGKMSAPYKFSGYLHISSNGLLLADLPIGSDKAWQTGYGYVLTGAGLQNTNVPPLSKFIQSHKSYDFEISFEPSPPPASSIWLYCLQSGKDIN